MSRPEPPLFQASGIRLGYRLGSKTVDVLDGVDLVLEPGEVVALVGPSGSGKTTLLNVICGWERPDAGRLEWRGNAEVVLASLDWAEISIVPQSSGLLEDLTVAENVSLARRLRVRGGGAGPVIARDGGSAVGGLLDRLGIAHLGDRFPREISLGEQQRTSVARAVLLTPSLVLADEPVAHQDGASAGRVMDVLRDASASGSCCLIATHSPNTIDRSDRVVSLR